MPLTLNFTAYFTPYAMQWNEIGSKIGSMANV